MSLHICSLNSGSNGNCYYIGNNNEAILVDAGISCRETEKRMIRASLSIEKVKAIFISHEHSDHIRGLEVLAKKYNIPVYITAGTLRSCNIKLNENLLCSFNSSENIIIGDLSVIAFKKFHDASDPHSFVVEGNGIRIGVFTDIGVPCKQLTHWFKYCNAAFLEANYDEEMLMNGRYPWNLKKRISGGQGHLSNKQSLELFVKHKPDFMSHLILSHLSKENNDPELVHELFLKHSDNTQIVVAPRHNETEVYRITASNYPKPLNRQNIFRAESKKNNPPAKPSNQISLF